MKKTILAILSVAAVVMSTSCQRDPILYPTSDYYVAVKVNIDTDRDPAAAEPTLYVASFYDTLSHKLLHRAYIRPASHPAGLPPGGYVQGIEPGAYDMLVYNIDSRVTSVENADYYPQVYARTGVNTYSGNTPIIYAPDHLYVCSERVHVPYITAEDGVYVIDSELSSVAEPWRVIVRGIRNLDIAQGLSFLLSGQTRGVMLSDRAKLSERAIVLFAGAVDSVAVKSGEGLQVDTRYNTFGKLAGDDLRCLMTLTVTGPNGSVYYVQEDVTQQILESQDTDRTIIIDADIEIRPREDGGFAPVAEPWNPSVVTIDLE